MYNFCTLFDSAYLTRGLAMYKSLGEHCSDFHLYILAFDELCYATLKALGPANVTVIGLQEFEDERLLGVKSSRTKGEYCWTCTSHAIRYVLERYDLGEVTYLDADLYFFGRPSVLLEEFERSGGSVLITEHRYTPGFDHAARAGIYCVQFITFRADERGLAVLQWWQDRCLEWCYAHYEDGKFGDQKYLDDWPQRFEGIHVLEHPGGGVAPWNVQRYALTREADGLKVNGKDLIFYHFHFFSCYTNGQYDLGMKKIPEAAVELVYRPYIKALAEAKQQVRRVDENFEFGEVEKYKDWTYPFRYINRRIRGYYHVIK